MRLAASELAFGEVGCALRVPGQRLLGGSLRSCIGGDRETGKDPLQSFSARNSAPESGRPATSPNASTQAIEAFD